MGVMHESSAQETKHLLRENIRLTRENNKLLHKLWRAKVTGFWTKILFYALIIGIPWYIYQQYVASYIKQLHNSYNELYDTVEEVNELRQTLPAAVFRQFQDSGEQVE